MKLIVVEDRGFNYRPWSRTEDELLVLEKERGFSIAKMAFLHDRTEQAIRSRLRKIRRDDIRTSGPLVRTPLSGDTPEPRPSRSQARSGRDPVACGTRHFTTYPYGYPVVELVSNPRSTRTGGLPRMNDLEVAALVLAVAARMDSGCVPCVQGCVDEALFQRPELPWEDAVTQIRPESTRWLLTEAIATSRSSMNLSRPGEAGPRSALPRQ